MPFASLSPEKQKFLSSYFKPKTFFKKGTSDAEKDSMADSYDSWMKARDLASHKLMQLGATGIDLSALKAELKSADDLMADKKSLKSNEAKAIAQGMLPKIDAAGQKYCDAARKKATDAIDRASNFVGVALELPRLDKRLGDLDTAAKSNPVDFAGVKSASEGIVAKEALLKQVSDAYRVRYDDLTSKIYHWGTVRLALIDDELVKDGRKNAVENIKVAEQKRDEGSDKLAEQVIKTVSWAIDALVKQIKERDDFLLVKQDCENKIKALMDKRNPGVDEECNRIIDQQKLAKTAEAAKDFYLAGVILKAQAERATGLLPMAAKYEEFEASALAAQTASDALKKHKQAAYIEPHIQEIQTYIDAAMELAGGQDYAKATVRMDGVPDMCKAATDKAAESAPFDALAAEASTGDLGALLQQAKDLLAGLQKHPRAALAIQALADLARDVAVVETAVIAKDEPAAREALKKVAELAVGARKLMDAIDMLYARADKLGAGTEALRDTHPYATYIKVPLAAILEIVKKAKADAVNGVDGVIAALVDGEANLAAATKLANDEERYRFHRQEVEQKVKELAPTTVSYPDKEATEKTIKEHLDTANESSKAFDHVKAEGMLKAIEALLSLAKIGVSTQAGTAPDPNEIKALMAMPNGQKILDDLIDSMSGTAQQDVVKAVMEARFGMEVNLFTDEETRKTGTKKTGTELDVPAPDLAAYYKMLKSVPETHTKLNPSLARFDQVEDETGSYYESQNGAVVMACKKVMNNPNNPVGDPSQLDQIDEDSVSRTDVPEPTYGKWTTLHEIGHAVDDRKKFMDTNGKSDAFGGWVSYGTNVAPIAKVMTERYKYDSRYIEETLLGGSPATPDVDEDLISELGQVKAVEEWTKRKGEFDNWFASVRMDKKVWDSASEVKRLAVNGVMYHEAYKNSWVSYKVAARNKGVTGYQFRAPGEWFSELYAAFYTNKLGKNHPARKWLATL